VQVFSASNFIQHQSDYTEELHSLLRYYPISSNYTNYTDYTEELPCFLGIVPWKVLPDGRDLGILNLAGPWAIVPGVAVEWQGKLPKMTK